MAGLIPQSFIDDLLNRTDIVEVVSSRIQLKKTGKNYSACCPFHKEKTPSFTVSPDKQFYYCFWLRRRRQRARLRHGPRPAGVPQAVEELAKRAGMDVPRENAADAGTRRASRPTRRSSAAQRRRRVLQAGAEKPPGAQGRGELPEAAAA